MSFYCHELPYQSDAARYFAAIAALPWAVWLDSGGMARFDILTAAPHHTLLLDGLCCDPFALLRSELGEQAVPIADVPFAGGALGYWSYDLLRVAQINGHDKDATHEDKTRHARSPHLNPLPHAGEEANESLREFRVNAAQQAETLHLMAVGIYDWALLLDHQEKTARLVSHQRYVETAALIEKIIQYIHIDSDIYREPFRVLGEIGCNFTKASYASAFTTVQDYLQSGDCYQVNLAQCFSASATGDALEAYLKLRELSPAPYSAYLNLPGVQILCASPERFISVQQGRVETKPIKGTRPRDSNPERDRQLAEELSVHPKDRAENLMIVDLLRNDLGKNCQPGSVRVPKLFEVESYANVHHLVSTVQGELSDGRDALDVLSGCFPGGSITGAPKLRAMQIIGQLEPDGRGIYCGAIGYVGFDGNMDTNIVIRTLVYANNEIRCWAGGGLVADSQCDAEYQETLDKASAMLALLQRYGGELGSASENLVTR